MRLSPLVVGLALLSLTGCVAGGYPYDATASAYAPEYAPSYGYGYSQPFYAPQEPFLGNAFLFEFGGRRHHRDYDGGYDRGGRGDGGWHGRR